jgi:hypothetical protein
VDPITLKSVTLYKSVVVAVVSAHIPMHHIYLGRFYVRSEIIHKSLPDCCVGKDYYMGRFHEVHLYEQCVVAVLSAHIPMHYIYLGRVYVRSEVIHKSLPDYCVSMSWEDYKNFDLTSHIK